VYSAAWRGGQEEVPMPEPEEQGEQDVTQELLDRGWVGQPTADGVAYERGQPTYADGGAEVSGDLETMLRLANQEVEGAELRQGDIPEGEEYAMFNGLPEMLQSPLVLGALALGAFLLFRKKIR